MTALDKAEARRVVFLAGVLAGAVAALLAIARHLRLDTPGGPNP